MIVRIRRFLVNIILALAMLLLCWAATEILLKWTVLRFNEYPKPPGIGIPYTIKTLEFEHSFVANSWDMRGPEVHTKPDGAYRVVCMGDSFTFGLGVEWEETYPLVLSRRLRNRIPQIDVINAGGANAATERLKFLHQYGDELKPDIVVLQIYIGNDIYDGARYLPQFHTSTTDVAMPTKPTLPARMRDWIRRESLLAKLTWHFLIRLDGVDDFLYRKNLRYSDRGIYLKNYPDFEEKLTEWHLKQLGLIQSWLQARDIPLILLIAPSRQQVYMGDALDLDRYDYQKPNRFIREFCRKRDIPYVDMLEVYENIPAKDLRALYYHKDMHWTTQGHALAAHALENLIPSP